MYERLFFVLGEEQQYRKKNPLKVEIFFPRFKFAFTKAFVDPLKFTFLMETREQLKQHALKGLRSFSFIPLVNVNE